MDGSYDGAGAGDGCERELWALERPRKAFTSLFNRDLEMPGTPSRENDRGRGYPGRIILAFPDVHLKETRGINPPAVIWLSPSTSRGGSQRTASSLPP
jgi:hypothetical protein